MKDLDTLQTRYRPDKWGNIIGQEHITDVLRGILKNQTFHYTRSYILSGCITEDTKLRIRVRKKKGANIAVSSYDKEKDNIIDTRMRGISEVRVTHNLNCSKKINKNGNQIKDEGEYKEISLKELREFYTEGYEVEVASEDGWVSVNEVYYKGKKSCVQVSTTDFELTCSENHLINISTNWDKDDNNPVYMFASDLKVNRDLVNTVYGVQPVTDVKHIGERETWDISVGHKNERYYANGVSSHNSPGSGKTSTARLFAAGINCDNEDHSNKPCHSCKSCNQFFAGQYPDYLEVDAGQYNKVEDVKKLIDVAKIYPVNPSKFRVILLDEAHRLSNAAWDSMLKLLEDGVTKTIFIFATTEGDKIRRAIHSRSISFQVKPLSVPEIRNELIRICKKEGIEYDVNSIESIAHSNRGRMRDAIKTLDMFNRSKGKITDISISTSEEKFCQILAYTSMGKYQDSLDILDKMTMDTIDLGNCLCNTISAIYCYPILNNSGVPESVLNRTKKILGNSISKIIELFMTYKPSNYEQVKLFLVMLSDIGSQKQKQENNTTKRVLFKTRKNEEIEDEDF